MRRLPEYNHTAYENIHLLTDVTIDNSIDFKIVNLTDGITVEKENTSITVYHIPTTYFKVGEIIKVKLTTDEELSSIIIKKLLVINYNRTCLVNEPLGVTAVETRTSTFKKESGE